MALRSSWDGYLKLSLISVPVRAYNLAVRGKNEIHFHQIHRACGNRIRYQKTCPVHGEIPKEEIVSGYEIDKGEFIEIEPEEVKKLRAEDDESINIDAFTSPTEVDPLYYTGRTFYLVPDGPAGQKPYVLLHQVMRDQGRNAIARMVLSGHEETVLIRPLERLLAMTVLYYQDQIKQPAAFEDEVGEPKLSAAEIKLAGTLVEASTVERVDLSQYKDLYTDRVTQMIEAKSSGKKLPNPRRDKRPAVINLMDALRKSLDRAQKKPSSGKGSPRKKKTG